MKKFLRLLGLLVGLTLASQAPAQTQSNYNFNVGGLGYSSGIAVPGSCTVDGSFFWLNTGTKAWYTCVTGTWTALGGGGGGGTLLPSGTPTSNQIALWVDATHIKGVTQSGDGTFNSSGVFSLTGIGGNLFSAALTGQVFTGLNAGIPTFTSSGLGGRTVSGATDTILCDSATAVRDRSTTIEYSNATGVAVTLPQAGSSGCSANFNFAIEADIAPVTVTPTTSTITSYNGYRTLSAQTSLVIPAGSHCAISSPDNSTYVARCAPFNPPASYGLDASQYTANSSTNIGVMVRDALADTAHANLVGPTVRIPTLGAAWTMSTDPFSTFAGQGCHILQQGVTITSDVTIFLPNKCDWIGTVKGDYNSGGTTSSGSSIGASSTFRTGFPKVQSTSGTDSACFLSGDANIVAGTMNAGGTACVAGASTPFTSNLVGYVMYILPTGTTVPGGIVPNTAIPVGIVRTFTDNQHIALWRNIAAPVAQPSNTTGYIYAFVRAMGVIGMPSLGAGCPAFVNCIGNQQRFENVQFECGDNSSGDANNSHVGLVNIYGQEQEWWQNVGTRNCGWSDWVIASTGTQDSGPYSGIIGGGNGPASEIPVLVWQPGYFHGFTGNITINTGVTEISDIKYVNTVSQGGVKFDGVHGESAIDLITCGELTVWPWSSGTGCKGTDFLALSAANTITNIVHIVNATGTPSANLSVEVSSGNSGPSPIAVLDDVHGKSYSLTAVGPLWTFGADNLVDGHYDGDQPFPNYVTGGGTAQAQTATLNPPLLTLSAGIVVRWKPSNANSAAAPTLAVNGLTATAITKCGTAALVANDLLTTTIAEAMYDGTQFQLQNPQTGDCGQEFVIPATDSGAINAYVINPNPPVTLAIGTQVLLKPANTNSGASTVNVNGLGVKNITKNGTTPVGGNDLASTNIYLLTYDGTEWIVMNNGLGCATCTRTAGTPVNHQAGIFASSNTIGNTSTTLQYDATNSFWANYNNEALAGVGTSYIRGVTSQKTETQAADANVLTVTPAAAVGTYRVCLSVSVSASTAGVVGWTLSWTDSNAAAQANIAQSLFQQGTAAPALTFVAAGASNYQSCSMVDVNAAAATIVVKWVGGGTSIAAKVTASIERVN